MPLFTDRTKGLLIALFGVICITPDAVLVRYLSTGGVEAWTIVFWKMFLSLPLTLSYALYDMGGWKALKQNVSDPRGLALYGAAILPQAGVNIGFTFSFVYTTTAHALLLININPLWCALLGWFCLHEALPTHTIVALVLAMGCMLLTFVPEIVAQEEENNDNNDDDNNDIDNDELQSTTKGNMMSLATGLVIAIYITLIRKGGMEGRNMIIVSPIAAMVASILAFSIQSAQVLPTHIINWAPERNVWTFWMTVCAEGIIVGVVFICIAIAPRLITGSEMALVLLLEVILGPLWVFLAYQETPSSWTLIGGLSLVLVLALHEVYPLIFLPKEEEEEEQDSSSFSSVQLDKNNDKNDDAKKEESDEMDFDEEAIEGELSTLEKPVLTSVDNNRADVCKHCAHAIQSHMTATKNFALLTVKRLHCTINRYTAILASI